MRFEIGGHLPFESFNLGSLRAGEDELAKNTEAGVATTKAEGVREIIREGLDFFGNSVAHLVGKGDEVELRRAESLMDDRVRILVIVIIGLGEIGDFVTFEDEAVSRSNIFVKFADGKTDLIE